MTQTQERVRRAAPAGLSTGLSTGLGTALDATARVAPTLAGRAALELWRRPGRRAVVRPEERAVHESARVGTAGPAGREVVTYAWGDGARPVLLVHGWASRASRFAALVTALLAEGRSVVSYDAWGHGASRGAAGTILEHQVVVADLVERHGPFESAVAHSFGVPVMLYGARHGLGADRMVAISGVGEFGSLIDVFCARLGAGQVVDRELRRAIERRWFDGDTGIWERFSAQPAPGRDLLVVHDTEDRMVERAQADVVTAAYGSRATMLETTGLGHGRILHDPGVVRAVVGFLS